jgi:hypothetical protein
MSHGMLRGTPGSWSSRTISTWRERALSSSTSSRCRLSRVPSPPPAPPQVQYREPDSRGLDRALPFAALQRVAHIRCALTLSLTSAWTRRRCKRASSARRVRLAHSGTRSTARCVRAWTRACIRVCVRACVRGSVHACVRVSARACVYLRVRACVRAWSSACVCLRLWCLRLRAQVHAHCCAAGVLQRTNAADPHRPPAARMALRQPYSVRRAAVADHGGHASLPCY